jgi:hypothetical protein
MLPDLFYCLYYLFLIFKRKLACLTEEFGVEVMWIWQEEVAKAYIRTLSGLFCRRCIASAPKAVSSR